MWKHSDILIWPNWWPGVTSIEVLSSYQPVPGFQGGTVSHTSVTKMEKKGHQISYITNIKKKKNQKKKSKRRRRKNINTNVIEKRRKQQHHFCKNTKKSVAWAWHTYIHSMSSRRRLPLFNIGFIGGCSGLAVIFFF